MQRGFICHGPASRKTAAGLAITSGSKEQLAAGVSLRVFVGLTCRLTIMRFMCDFNV
jgi:hypothetical protein